MLPSNRSSGNVSVKRLFSSLASHSSLNLRSEYRKSDQCVLCILPVQLAVRCSEDTRRGATYLPLDFTWTSNVHWRISSYRRFASYKSNAVSSPLKILQSPSLEFRAPQSSRAIVHLYHLSFPRCLPASQCRGNQNFSFLCNQTLAACLAWLAVCQEQTVVLQNWKVSTCLRRIVSQASEEAACSVRWTAASFQLIMPNINAVSIASTGACPSEAAERTLQTHSHAQHVIAMQKQLDTNTILPLISPSFKHTKRWKFNQFQVNRFAHVLVCCLSFLIT